MTVVARRARTTIRARSTAWWDELARRIVRSRISEQPGTSRSTPSTVVGVVCVQVARQYDSDTGADRALFTLELPGASLPRSSGRPAAGTYVEVAFRVRRVRLLLTSVVGGVAQEDAVRAALVLEGRVRVPARRDRLVRALDDRNANDVRAVLRELRAAARPGSRLECLAKKWRRDLASARRGALMPGPGVAPPFDPADYPDPCADPSCPWGPQAHGICEVCGSHEGPAPWVAGFRWNGRKHFVCRPSCWEELRRRNEPTGAC